MKTWAKLNKQNIVIDIIKVADEKKNVKEWLTKNFGDKWEQTFSVKDVEDGTDTERKGNFAVVGGTFDQEKKVFLFPKPFDSWILNEETLQWEAPSPKPEDENNYVWNEELQQWAVEE